MVDFYSVLFGSGLIAFTYFYLNPTSLQKVTTHISWYSVRSYHTVNIYLTNYVNNYVNNKIPDQLTYEETFEEEEMIIVEGLTDEDNLETYEISEGYNFELEDMKISFSCLEKEDKTYYQRLVNDKSFEELCEDEEKLEVCSRQFLQIELVNANEKVDIHEHISKYYVNNNTLFDEEFMNYFMKKWYNMDLDSDYKINIIDKNIKLLCLERGNSLLLSNDTYELK
jgi:hypothetical protein